MEDPVRCWCCERFSIDETSCSWCGVWLADLSPTHFPASPHSLLALARRWGIGDDGYRDMAVDAASSQELAALLHSVDRVSQEDLDDWLCGPEADAAAPSIEYVAITCLTMAAAKVRLVQ